MEGNSTMTLPKLRILRSYCEEMDATELYRNLSSAAQGPKDTPQDFLVRALDL